MAIQIDPSAWADIQRAREACEAARDKLDWRVVSLLDRVEEQLNTRIRLACGEAASFAYNIRRIAEEAAREGEEEEVEE